MQAFLKTISPLRWLLLGVLVLMSPACAPEEDEPPPAATDRRSTAELETITQDAKAFALTDSGITDFTLIDGLTTPELTTLNDKVVADMEFTQRFLEDLGHTDIVCTNTPTGTVTITGSFTKEIVLPTLKLEADDLNITFRNCAGVMVDRDGDGVADGDSIDFNFRYWGSVRFNVVTLVTIVSFDPDTKTTRMVFTFDEYFDGGLVFTDGPNSYFSTIRNTFLGTDDTTVTNAAVYYNSWDYTLHAVMESRVCDFADAEAEAGTPPPSTLPWICD